MDTIKGYTDALKGKDIILLNYRKPVDSISDEDIPALVYVGKLRKVRKGKGNEETIVEFVGEVQLMVQGWGVEEDDTLVNNFTRNMEIKSASKVQDRWITLSDEEWDKELEIISELTSDEFIDFIKADFGLSNMVKLAAHHPKLAVRQLFNIVKGSK